MSYCKWIGRLFWFWYGTGLLLMLFYRVPEALAFSNGVFLFLYGLYAASLRPWPEGASGRAWFVASLIAVAGLGCLAEFSGVATGFPFGSYHYTPTLGIGLFGVPLAIAAAWVGVVRTGVLLASSLSRPLRALAVGFYAAALDLVLDPAAHALGFWTWHDNNGFYGVPWSNFAAWFVISALLSLLLPPSPAPAGQERTRALRLYQGMLLMFGLLAWKEALWMAVLIAAAVIAWTEWRSRRDRREQKSVL